MQKTDTDPPVLIQFPTAQVLADHDAGNMAIADGSADWIIGCMAVSGNQAGYIATACHLNIINAKVLDAPPVSDATE